MKRRTRAESLEYRLSRLQADIYNYSSDMEDKAEKTGNKEYADVAQLATEAGFELDVSQQKMQDAIKLLNELKSDPIS
jgi:hypothetical protein